MLHFSAKEEYAVLAILALSLHSGQGPLQVKSIAQKEKIPARFLEQVMNLLKKQGLVESVRGPYGGYRLKKPPEKIRLGEVLRAIEGPLSILQPAERKQGRFSTGDDGEAENLVLKEVWAEVDASLKEHLDSITFKDLCDRKNELEAKKVLMFHI